MPELLNFFIVSRSGGLMYTSAFSSRSCPKLSGNDSLDLASKFYTLHSIAAQISPVEGSGGIECLRVESFTLQCLQTPTGLKFFVTADPRTSSKILKDFLDSVYLLYVDYVLKNPFYVIDMPIRCELFDQHLEGLVSRTRALSSA